MCTLILSSKITKNSELSDFGSIVPYVLQKYYKIKSHRFVKVIQKRTDTIDYQNAKIYK